MVKASITRVPSALPAAEFREKLPRNLRWQRALFDGKAPLDTCPEILSWTMWRHGGLVVISALEVAEYPDGTGETGPQWHISARCLRSHRRPTDAELRLVRAAFGMKDAEEDNHEPGRCRHLWLPVSEARRVACECKETEVTVIEQDGHRWQAPPDEVVDRRDLMERVWGGGPTVSGSPLDPPTAGRLKFKSDHLIAFVPSAGSGEWVVGEAAAKSLGLVKGQPATIDGVTAPWRRA